MLQLQISFTETNIKVKDHDHLKATNNVIGYACNRCNLAMKPERLKQLKIPVYFHNGAGYDWKLIMKHLGEYISTNSQNKRI